MNGDPSFGPSVALSILAALMVAMAIWGPPGMLQARPARRGRRRDPTCEALDAVGAGRGCYALISLV
ncbi:hypothetical protein B1759_15090 [Rubrivirga sp. SAORIC476]|uniref:hypothetical protein n=1 Tax=Rubrivirga sp. SAORIC476 TaxID=1961794 RepID=UPI000BA96B4C|nr:hypothetical protein [Rubrivirga sp. SAORIC476]PAP79642.1 hypothetical protein B1759_15090 [Rubrivirga sp. SAORIC476]